MLEVIQISKKQVVFALVGILVATCLGVLVGSYIVRVRAESGKKPGASLLLKTGQPFPQERFVGIDANQPDLFESLKGKKSILIFLTTGCGYCDVVVEKWVEAHPRIRSEYQVYGISYEKISNLELYQKKMNIPFYLYNDSLGGFTGKYKFDTYPTIVGINEKGEIVFIKFGNNPKKTAEDYLKLL